MFTPRGATFPLLCLGAVLAVLEQPAPTQEASAKIWVGRHQEIEEYLRTAECVSLQTLTKLGPAGSARCTLPPGGPVARMAWKPARPGVYRGFRETYETEIAAYELDKLLRMDMVPPSVERQLQGHEGAAQLWLENVVDATDSTSPDQAQQRRWGGQLRRMAVFDNLIGNRARNLRNMLRDAAWNLILIDHSQAFGTGTELLHKVSGVDEAYWAQIEGLTRSQLDAALRRWLDDDEIQAILDRRERMRAEIRSLPK
jgi:hypothetical protein